MARHLNLYIIVQLIMLISIGGLGFAGEIPDGGGEIVDRIVAIVNDDIVTYLEVQEAMLPYEVQIKRVGYDPEKEQQMLHKVRTDIVNKLVDQKITDQQIKRYKISVSEEEIDSNIEQIKSINFLTDEDLRKALEKEGNTLESYRGKLKEQAMRTRLVNTAVRSKIVITKEDIAAYYADNPIKYQGELKYHLRNIRMRVLDDAGVEGKRAVLEKMEKVHAELEKGAAFESLSRQHSESSMASKGGDIGVLAYKNFSPQLKEALEGLVAGEYTPILDTDQGYQIFFVEKILKESRTSLEDASSDIEDILFKELSENAFTKWLEELREASHIKIIL